MEYQIEFKDDKEVKINSVIVQIEDFSKTLFMKMTGFNPFSDKDGKIATEYMKYKKGYKIIPTSPNAYYVNFYNTHGILLKSFKLKAEEVNKQTEFTKFYTLDEIIEEKQQETLSPFTEPLDLSIKPGKNYCIEEYPD